MVNAKTIAKTTYQLGLKKMLSANDISSATVDIIKN